MLKCYYMDLESDCSEEQSLVLYKTLLPDRKDKVDRLKNIDMKKKQILTSAFLQYVLSACLNIPIKDIRFNYNSYGKPSIDMSDIYFNMSHSGSYVIVAISDHPVGVDVERRRNDRIGVAKRCFCKEEYEYITGGGDKDEVLDRFLLYWTMKEAYVKYIGMGLAVPLNSFKIIYDNEDCYRIDAGDEPYNGVYEIKKDVLLTSFRLDLEYRFSICCKRGCLNDYKETKYSVLDTNKVELNALFGA